jgi:HD-like signal output (HDOD) protein
MPASANSNELRPDGRGPVCLDPARPNPGTRAWSLHSIPPFAPIALRLLNMVSQDGANLRQISHMVSADPGLTQDVIRVANSPLVGARYEIAGILHALAMLGLERVKGLVTTVALRDFLAPVRGCGMFLPCWRHTLACAILAARLSRPLSLNPDRTYTAGLLHEIGRLALLAAYPEEYEALLRRSIEEQCDSRPWEKQVFGADCVDVGRQLAQSWKLPRSLAEAILPGTSPGGGQFGVPELVDKCCRLADLIGFQVDGAPLPCGIAEFIEEFPAWARDWLRPDLESISLEVVTQINGLECSLLV